MQCKDCQFSELREDGKRIFTCNPFENIVEPECIAKWQLIKLDQFLEIQAAQLRSQQSMAPMQSRIMKYIERELKDLEDADNWKNPEDQEDDYFDL